MRLRVARLWRPRADHGDRPHLCAAGLLWFILLKADLNSQLEILENSKPKLPMKRNGASARPNSDRRKMGEKDAERVRLGFEYKVFMSNCKKRIERHRASALRVLK